MILCIFIGIQFLLAIIFFSLHHHYNMPKKKMIQKMRFRKRNPLSKKDAEKIAEKNLPTYKRKARKAKVFVIFTIVLFLLEIVIKIGMSLFSNGAYRKIEVCVWKDETLRTTVDPVSFMNQTDNGSADGRKKMQEEMSDTASNENTEQEDVADDNRDALQSEEYSIENQEKSATGVAPDNNKDITEENSKDNPEATVIEESNPDNIGEMDKSASNEKSEDAEGEEPSEQQEDGKNTASIGITIEGSVDDDKVTEGDKTSDISYDFCPLYLWGPYEFGDQVTGQDLTNIKNMVNGYFTNAEYTDMFEEILEAIDEDYGNYKDIHEKVDQFKSEKESNPELLSASKYFENTTDRLFLYKENRNNNVLEQAAISAESAVEEEQLSDSERYANYINYARTGIIIFCYVSNLDLKKYDSGTKWDVMYRIGKLIYKPAANMVHLTFNDKCYCLSSSYIILGDVFKNWGPEQKYAVEIPFYYLTVCMDLVSIMEPGEARKEVCKNAINAYDRFIESGEMNPDNLTYVKYATDADEKLKYIEKVYASEIEKEQVQIQDENFENTK